MKNKPSSCPAWIVHQETAESWPVILEEGNPVPIARMNGTWRGDALANAYLVAASPDLLNALVACASIIQEKFGKTVTREGIALHAALQAISKAKGGRI